VTINQIGPDNTKPPESSLNKNPNEVSENEKSPKPNKKIKFSVAGLILLIIDVLLIFLGFFNINFLTIYTKDIVISYVVLITISLNILLLSLWLFDILKINVCIILIIIIDFFVLLFFLLTKTAHGQEAASNIKIAYKKTAQSFNKFFCYLNPENVASGNFEKCETTKVEKEGKYENLLIKFGTIDSSGKNVRDSNSEPISGKPYNLNIVLENINPKNVDPNYDIKIKKIEGYASPFSTDVLKQNFVKTVNDQLFVLKSGEVLWKRLEFKEMPMCFGSMYFIVRVTSEQNGIGASNFVIAPDDETANSKFVDFSFKSSPGPVDIEPRLYPPKSIINSEYNKPEEFVVKIINKGENTVVVKKIRIEWPFDYINVDKCSSTEVDDIKFEKCFDNNNCVNIALEPNAVVNSFDSFEINCKISIIEEKYKSNEISGYIQSSVNYEYIVESIVYSRRAKCYPISSTITSISTTNTFYTTTTVEEKLEIIDIAKSALDHPYLLGAGEWDPELPPPMCGSNKCPTDCSAFTKWVFNRYAYLHGLQQIIAVRLASWQGSNVGQIVDGHPDCEWNCQPTNINFDALREGDLIFFCGTYDRNNDGVTGCIGDGVTHVGIYAGNKQIIHASINGVATSNLDTDYYRNKYVGARRV